METTETLENAFEEAKKATKYIKIMTQYSPPNSEVEAYIFSYEEVVNKYNHLEELTDYVDEHQNSEEIAKLIYEAARDVIHEVQSFYNEIRGIDELEAKLKEEVK